VWSIFRRDFEAKKSNVMIEVANCLTCLEFHPLDPLVLAGGTINGEIYIWNVGAEGGNAQVVCKSEADEYFHREPIRRINWLTFESVHSLALSICLVTISSDGKILMWENPMKSLRYPIKGHMTARVKNNNLQVLGGTNIAMIAGAFGLDENAFIVGTEGGVV
jgi:WD repeat-containing protein 34